MKEKNTQKPVTETMTLPKKDVIQEGYTEPPSPPPKPKPKPANPD